MKTPMQFLLEKIENGDFLDKPKLIGEFIKHNLLEKEKEIMCQFADEFAIECINYHHEKTMSEEKFFDLTYGGNKWKQ
jgi:hypothetical protein